MGYGNNSSYTRSYEPSPAQIKSVHLTGAITVQPTRILL